MSRRCYTGDMGWRVRLSNIFHVILRPQPKNLAERKRCGLRPRSFASLRSLRMTLIGVIILFHPFNSILASFDPNYLLPDYELIDWQAMDYREIEDFLLRRGSILASYVDPVTRQIPAQVIFDSAVVYRVNPKVILTLLQKEQSLIDDPLPSQDQYTWATGFAICDSCSKSDPALQIYRGFTTQVDRAAWRLRYYLDYPDEFKFKTGGTYLIDGISVTMTNDATRALYTYTPHLHGNQNFVEIWKRWFAKDYPDGVVLKNRDTGELWLLQAGNRRKFASRAVVLSRMNLDQAIPASPLDLDKYARGDDIKFAEYSLLRSPRGTVYLYVNDSKRGIENRKVFKILGFNPEEVTPASWADLNSIPDGPVITMKSAFPLGALIQDTTSGGVWYVQDGVRHALMARELLALYPKNKVIPKKPYEIAEYEIGEPVKLKDGMIVKRPDEPAVAIIANGRKRPFASWEAYESLGFKAERIMTVPERLWNLHEEGEIIDIEIQKF